MSENMDEKKELNYDELIPTLPRDKDGFIVGFDIYTGDDEAKQQENKKEIHEFFERYGVVVITNLLTDEELTKSQVEVYDFVEDNYERFKRNNTSTWENIFGLSAKLGMITDWPCMKLQYCKNRCNPNIYRAFSYILDDNDIYCNIGRVGYFRPTKNIPFVATKKKEEDDKIQEQVTTKKDDQIKDEDKDRDKKKEDEEVTTVYEDRPEWKTLDGLEWLHIDYNPALNHSTTYAFMPTKYTETYKDKYDPYQKSRVQGIVALVDCDDSTGGFQCVPGFHNILDRCPLNPKSSWKDTNLKMMIPFSNTYNAFN
ncbi:hypothetical protein RFI_23782 [Reticulomyxa filosa]|uniref:Uncharacterized protein n=1 Tax=Reticulomyxa filosa TaxID=46433 RepID=X6MJG7_RETFI|nr:hypothetical protein RFI_23782 [Reticulomyxa filosa]|eukprot:ETO13587.1 hypothetical protein RFI_23782 [Reticulomyxa filosa]